LFQNERLPVDRNFRKVFPSELQVFPTRQFSFLLIMRINQMMPHPGREIRLISKAHTNRTSENHADRQFR
ncbi:MAG TPA: hypothetical protein DCY03_31315, partial [Planctomycetaceae bacterium]|nr:hypothetical protein [Planctomycetaceae bacterium]